MFLLTLGLYVMSELLLSMCNGDQNKKKKKIHVLCVKLITLVLNSFLFASLRSCLMKFEYLAHTNSFVFSMHFDHSIFLSLDNR